MSPHFRLEDRLLLVQRPSLVGSWGTFLKVLQPA